MIYIVDFGSQVANLIGRKLREVGAEIEVIAPEEIVARVKQKSPLGIVLSGGPASVYGKKSPQLDNRIFDFNIPILGICYGLQIIAKNLGGKVIPGRKEYGPEILEIKDKKSKMLSGVMGKSTVWMSHGDEVVKIPSGFKILGSTKNVKNAFIANKLKKIYGAQFHPEVEHTQFGQNILENFVSVCKIKKRIKKIDVNRLIKDIKISVGNELVIGAVSGGVDSTVAAFLTAKAIGKNFIPFFIDNGLMRTGTKEHIDQIFDRIGIKVQTVNTHEETLRKLKGITDPELKRKKIGKLYISAFEKEMKALLKKGKKVKYLMQGTIYSDVIESKGTKHSAKIKSHHNVGGLPKNMKLKLIEPLRYFYKDEVRAIGKALGLPDDVVFKQPFPGPGYAVRIRGEVTKKRLKQIKDADNLVLDELEKAGFLNKVFQSFPILTGANSTAVKGDGRYFGEVVAVRIIESKNVMTCNWAKLPYEILQNISSRIVNEVPGISRVVYDITTKPPATMEWE